MPLVLYHRTSIAEARDIVRRGFRDMDWEFGLQDARTGDERVATGIWLSNRPLGAADGLHGDALLEVTVEADVDALKNFELEGMLWDGRFWVVPAEYLNRHARARFGEVDPRSSWFHQAWNGDDGASDRGREER
jgi:hypothetical protein